jgi:PAS domain S-box-containing protein
MDKTKIIVVEDEVIVAKDIQQTLIKLGYDVPATASNHAAALDRIEENRPDLIFMDIKLKGETDGVEIAGEIKDKYDIPVIFLTSFVDKTTLDRAKITEPYGYIVKPFNETDLRTAVELALYKHSRDKEIKKNRQFYIRTLQSLDDAFVITDSNWNITFVNPKSLQFAHGSNSVLGRDFLDVFTVEHEQGQMLNRNQIKELLSNAEDEQETSHMLYIAQDGSKAAYIYLSKIMEEDGSLSGLAIMLRPADDNHKPGSAPKSSATNLDTVFLPNSFFVKKGSLLVKVSLDNVLWVQAMDNYVIIKTESDQFIIHSTMKDIEAKLPSSSFVRVHRSYIISLDKINLLDENTVVLAEKTIPIGKSYKDNLMNRLNFL